MAGSGNKGGWLNVGWFNRKPAVKEETDPIVLAEQRKVTLEKSRAERQAEIDALRLALANEELEQLQEEEQTLEAEDTAIEKYVEKNQGKLTAEVNKIRAGLLELKKSIGAPGSSEDPSEMIKDIMARLEEIAKPRETLAKARSEKQAEIAAKEAFIAKLTAVPVRPEAAQSQK